MCKTKRVSYGTLFFLYKIKRMYFLKGKGRETQAVFGDLKEEKGYMQRFIHKQENKV